MPSLGGIFNTANRVREVGRNESVFKDSIVSDRDPIDRDTTVSQIYIDIILRGESNEQREERNEHC